MIFKASLLKVNKLMNVYKLTDGLSLVVEPAGKKIRLIIYNDDIELVCRKTSFTEINRFLAGANEQLFKGRLQLLKNNGNILFKVKNDIAGIIDINEFNSYLLNTVNN